jgi:hypothetical protein
MKQNKKDILNKLKNRDAGFSIPENYFSQFDNNMQENGDKVKSGFVTPEKYFDAFEEKMTGQLSKNVNLSTGFKVPDNYFEKFDQKVLNKIDSKKAAKLIKLKPNKVLKILSYSIAASLLLFFSLKGLKSNEAAFDPGAIEISEIERWMDEGLISFSSYELSETFDDVYLYGEDNYTEDEILDYLDGENIENLILEN